MQFWLKTKNGPVEVAGEKIDQLREQGKLRDDMRCISTDGGQTWLSYSELPQSGSPDDDALDPEIVEATAKRGLPKSPPPIAKAVPPAMPKGQANAAGPVQKRKPRYWLAVVIGIVAIFAFIVPAFALVCGLLILAVVGGSFVSQVQGFSNRLLRIDSSQQVGKAFRVGVAGAIGVGLLILSFAGGNYVGEQEELAAQRAAEKAEQERLTTEANDKVVLLVGQAKDALRNGVIGRAETKLTEATKTPHATELQQVRDLQDKINAASGQDAIRDILMGIPDAEFDQFVDGEVTPAGLQFGYAALDDKAREIGRSQIEVVADAREQRRQEQLAAEQARLAEEERRREGEAEKERERQLAERQRQEREEAERLRKEEEKRRQQAEAAERMLRLEAWTVAKNFVKDELLSPSTADFGNSFKQNSEDNVTKVRDGVYRVRGWVDGQNAFGATIRNNFVCIVRRTGDKQWECESIDVQ